VKAIATIASILSLATCMAQAQADSSDWTIRAGVHPIQPKSQNHAELHVRDGATVTVAATRRTSERWGIEMFAALPVEHEIALQGSEVATIRQLPAALSVQYQFLDPHGRVHGYAGVGLGYAGFVQERTSGAWAGAQLQLESSLGAAVHAGLGLSLGGDWTVSIDARWFDIDAEPLLNGRGLGTVELDPYAVGMTIGRRL
jgi:outer membrane protein